MVRSAQEGLRSKALGRSSAAAVAGIVATISGAAGAASLVSPPVAYDMYRPGEVRRLDGRYGQWGVSCDEVVRLRQRYCSLRTTVDDAKGQPLLALTVSTGDDGRPAALAELPIGTDLSSVVVTGIPGTAAQSGKRARKQPAASSRHLPLTRCDGQRCVGIWSLSPAELMAMHNGGRLAVQFTRVLTVDPGFSDLARVPRQSIVAQIPSEGFAQAVSASLQ